MISSLIRKVSCVVQVVWIIPEVLIKRVSQAQFSITLCLLGGFVNYRPESIHCVLSAKKRLTKKRWFSARNPDRWEVSMVRIQLKWEL